MRTPRRLIHYFTYDASATTVVGLAQADQELRLLHQELAMAIDLSHYPILFGHLRRALYGRHAVDFFEAPNGDVHLVRLSLREEW